MIASTLSVEDWRGAITLFEGLTSTRPSAVLENLSWAEVIQNIMPAEVRTVERKDDGRFFLPTVLRDAPLVGQTFEWAKARGLPLVGKMRSTNHVVAGTLLKLDLDGVGGDVLMRGMDILGEQRIANILFSTHSHGSKAGMRARVVIPLDEPATAQDYRCISCSAAQRVLGVSLDPSEGVLHQLAGCHVAHPERLDRSFKLASSRGYCASTKALLNDYQSKHPEAVYRPVLKQGAPIRALTPFDVTRIFSSRRCFDAG
jgi:hypothetical protein